MGSKKRKVVRHPSHVDAPRARPAHLKPQPQKTVPKRTESKSAKPHVEKPTIPFLPHERILLIGEGDLSFASSLVTHHKCTNVTATVLEKNLEELTEKYPEHHANIIWKTNEVDEDFDPEDYASDDPDRPIQPNNRVIFNTDATKPFPPSITRQAPQRIIFNFPHVGGRTTDVNRQVRYNQELLVKFFKAALSALAPAGSIVVTLFEGEPYTLWNIRDLGRHAGLHVQRSFRFQAGAYPGYAHARTLGVVRGKDGERSGWRGEERAARSYVFVRKGDEELPGPGKKRRRDDSSDEE